MERGGPGLVLQALHIGKDPQLEAALRVIAALDADLLLLTAVDYDRGLVLAKVLAGRLAELGLLYPHRFALRPNRGMATGLDLDQDGRLGGAGDAQGWGRFAGQGGMLLLSRQPIIDTAVRDFSNLLWRDLPGHLMPPDTPPELRETLRLSSTAHWEVPVQLPDCPGRQSRALRLLAYHATPPVFDGPEDRNGRRNHDETAFWLALLEGKLGHPPPAPPFVLLGDSNLDPMDGDGRPAAIRAVLHHPSLQDPAPRRSPRPQDPRHMGDPRLDTAIYPQIGGLRVDLVLPSRDLTVVAAGLLDGDGQPELAADLALASRHLPVWVELAWD